MSSANEVAIVGTLSKEGAAIPATGSDASEISQEQSYHVHWFRSTLFQVLVVGGVFFCAPGMYNALSSLGAGGLATPWWANASAAAGYAAMAFLCIIGGVIVSKLGVRFSLLLSSTGDIIYAGSLYLNSKNGTQWFLMLGSIISGMTDGLMYAVEGPIITSYPEEKWRGRMLALWVFMRNLASVIGGAIIFSLNKDTDSTGGVSLQTYLAIIGVMCVGPFISLLISDPSKVQRRDGVKIQLRKVKWGQTFKEWLTVISSKDLLLLCPLFFTSWFYGSYIGTLQTEYYTVRARALGGLVIPFGDVLGGYLIGAFLDWQRFSIATRARWSFGILMACNVLLWYVEYAIPQNSLLYAQSRVWTAIATKQIEDSNPVLDWDSTMFGNTFSLYIMFDLVTMATQTALYWIIGHMSNDFILLSYMTGLLRGVECVGQAVAYGVKSHDTSNWLSIGLNLGFVLVSIPFSWAVVRKVGVTEFQKLTLPENFQPTSEDQPIGDDEKVAHVA
ncbi:hypothetical protein DL96DRAFT_1696925 [Flagelloscypha sp. PMI_526]|nr:hypothetical protein DL96DRAFT_1696925 [Flagelloscypha sp. PMI_526]